MKESTERFIIHGNTVPVVFLPWIVRHAGRLGVSLTVDEASCDCIQFTVQGQADLLDAMEMACSLGPVDVWVERIDRLVQQ